MAMARAVAVKVARARAVALTHCCIWRVIAALVIPARQGAWEDGRESRAPLCRVVADIIVLFAADGGCNQRIASVSCCRGCCPAMVASFSIWDPRRQRRQCWRCCCTLLEVSLLRDLRCTAERGEDSMVDGSHGGEKGVGVEDNSINKFHKGGGGGKARRVGPAK